MIIFWPKMWEGEVLMKLRAKANYVRGSDSHNGTITDEMEHNESLILVT